VFALLAGFFDGDFFFPPPDFFFCMSSPFVLTGVSPGLSMKPALLGLAIVFSPHR
jgi:hypothetical protein